MGTNGKIVVGVDGSEAGVAALHWALGEARRRGAEVHAVTAWHMDPPIEGPPPMFGIPYRAKEVVLAEQQAQQDKAMARIENETRGVRVHRHMIDQWPPQALVHMSAGADLLVVGRHGQSWLSETLLGSVSAYCVRHASCPVVVIPAHKPVEQHERHMVAAPATPGPLY